MLLENGSQFITRSEFEANATSPNAPNDYSFDDYLSDNLNVGSYDKSDIIDALIKIIDDLQWHV